MPANRGVDVKFASKLDFSAEALVAHPTFGTPGFTCVSGQTWVTHVKVSFSFSHLIFLVSNFVFLHSLSSV